MIRFSPRELWVGARVDFVTHGVILQPLPCCAVIFRRSLLVVLRSRIRGLARRARGLHPCYEWGAASPWTAKTAWGRVVDATLRDYFKPNSPADDLADIHAFLADCDSRDAQK